MRTWILLHLVHLLVLSSRSLIPGPRNPELFCLSIRSEHGRTQCSFIQKTSSGAAVLFYWSIWTADHRVEECSISADQALLQNYMSGCHDQDTWDLHIRSSMHLNISLLLKPGGPCTFRPVTPGNVVWDRAFDAGIQIGSGSRRRRKRSWVFPGTLWCGQGSRAGDYQQLGMFERADKCCRDHDHCDHSIHPFTVHYGVFNPTFFTMSHCDCDHRFKQCLLDNNDTVSNMVGYTFFNILQVHCFDLTQKKRCTQINWLGKCTSDTVATYAILKHATSYNDTTSNTSVPETLVNQGNLSATAKPQTRKRKQRKQSKSQKSYAPEASAVGDTYLVHEPKTIAPVSVTAELNCLISCNKTLFHQKSKLVNQSISIPAAAAAAAGSSAPQHIKASTVSTKQIVTPTKKITLNKLKNITPWATTTAKTKHTKIYKPRRSKFNSGPPRGDHFQSNPQTRKDGTRIDASLHVTVSPKFMTSLANKCPRTNKFFQSMPQTKSKRNFTRRENISNSLSSECHPQKTRKSEMKQKSAKATKLPKIWNNTYFAFNTTAMCDVTRYLDDCKYQIKSMEKLYGHHNRESTTIYHCDCIHRLTDQLKQLKRIALLNNLLWKFVSMSCIEIPNTKECSKKRCSAILSKATELESLLIKQNVQDTVKDRRVPTNKRVSSQLYKHCRRILRHKSRKHVKHRT